MGAAPGLIIAAPSSGSGKTTVTLALLRAFRNAGVRVASAKAGPDYIDPGYHAAASGQRCINLDGWGMRDETLTGLAGSLGIGADLVLCEGVMGLFDGAAGGGGSTADLAVRTGWPVLLVMDVSGQAVSAVAVAEGFVRHRDDVDVVGAICNRVGGPGHERMLRDAFAASDVAPPLIGFLPRDPGLQLPERHLGLVQASEHDALDAFLEGAAAHVSAHLDLDRLRACATVSSCDAKCVRPLPPLGQRIAVAHDGAFAFTYPAVFDGWHDAGAAISFFSPLADEPPAADADAVYLPGGYPELHAGRLAANDTFRRGLRDAAGGGTALFGECGGYMVLGQGLVDANGGRHEMTGLLPLETSFADRRLHLGYRRLRTLSNSCLGDVGAQFTGHEFHYATVVHEGLGDPLFRSEDARGENTISCGLVSGTVAGSFIHLIDCAS
ncbi:MAG: cobyrinate a,c-diamide synthase [Alphaproteobacteria bacterium]|nr:cobyrinate a,c-diamide synthase [Alphaproteobacteria bacterium]